MVFVPPSWVPELPGTYALPTRFIASFARGKKGFNAEQATTRLQAIRFADPLPLQSSPTPSPSSSTSTTTSTAASPSPSRETRTHAASRARRTRPPRSRSASTTSRAPLASAWASARPRGRNGTGWLRYTRSTRCVFSAPALIYLPFVSRPTLTFLLV